MKRNLFTFLILVFTVIVTMQVKAVDDKKCQDCHVAIMAGKLKHTPVAQGCESCHRSNGNAHPVSDSKGFVLAKEMPDLCYTCHTPLNTKKIVHSPIGNGKCMLCHTPHSSDNQHLLKENPVGTTCLECHDDLEIAENKSQHSPVASGKCSECHDPHQSDNAKLVILDGTALCFKCHTKEQAGLSLKSVHPPFANKCSICHKPHGSKEEHMLTAKTTDLCFGCHDDLQDSYSKSKFPHKALVEGQSCSNCHSPHAATRDSLIKYESIGDACNKCHNLKLAEKKVQHSPVSNGRCSDCHDPHFSDNKNMVKGETTVLCVKCHEEATDELALANVHPPFKNKCTICHSAHGSDVDGILNKGVTELCVGCHDDFEEPLQKSFMVHQPLKDERSCANCHSGHASATEKLLLADQKATCLNCHGKVIRNGKKTVANMKLLLQRNKYIHGAIPEKGCTGCHNPHFAENPGLLVAKYSQDFYVNATKDTFALCFTCHNSQLMTEQNTSEATNFRDGNKNLHFIHLNGKKGRGCAVCHEIHASNNPRLIVDKNRFGSWDMKMNFESLGNGGSCQTGCHELKVYKR
jgi:predicted CXXCH cytochrome family protein